mgnify:CR=1 FL=1
MSIKIAVPDNPVYSELVFNMETEVQEEIKLYRVPESKCSELLLDNKVDAAFISPLDYGKSVEKGDFRIIPGPAIAYGGFSGKASIYFRPGTNSLNSCSSPDPDDYMIILGKLLLMERYDIGLKINKAKGSREDLLQQSDTVILWEESEPRADSLDISELWGDSFEIPLILGLWVCPAEDFHQDVADTIKRLRNNSLKTEEYLTEKYVTDEIIPREGFILRQWNDELENALEKTIDLLYYYQLLSEIGEIKILGRD